MYRDYISTPEVKRRTEYNTRVMEDESARFGAPYLVYHLAIVSVSSEKAQPSRGSAYGHTETESRLCLRTMRKPVVALISD